MRRIWGLSFVLEFVMAIFWSSQITGLLKTGLSTHNAAKAMVVFFLVTGFLQVPTGYLADRFGRKRATCVGLGLISAAFFSLIGNTSYILLSFSTAALGYTLITGAAIAWFFEYARDKHLQFNSTRFFLKNELLGRFANISASIISVYLIQVNTKLLWFASGLAALFGLLWAGITPASSKKPLVNEHVHRQSIFMSMGNIVSPVAFFLFLLGTGFLGLEFGTRMVVFQPFVVKIAGEQLMYLGYFQALLSIARLSGIFFYRLVLSQRWNTPYFAVLSLLIMSAVTWTASTISSYWLLFLVWSIGVFSISWYFPLRNDHFNALFHDKYRATLLSVDSMILNFSAAIGGSFVIPVFTAGNFSVAWKFAASVLCASAVSLFFSIIAFKMSRQPQLKRPVAERIAS